MPAEELERFHMYMEEKQRFFRSMIKNPKLMGTPQLIYFLRPQLTEVNQVVTKLQNKTYMDPDGKMDAAVKKFWDIFTGVTKY
jgi:hypothetical protein